MQTAQTILHVLSSPEVVRQVKDWLRENPHAGRSALAGGLCSTLKLQDRCGKPREAGVLVALRTLEARGFWKLPPAPPTRAPQQPRRLSTAVPPPQAVPAQVERVQGLRLVEVPATEEELFRTWNELMWTEHPLRDGRLVGRQLRYLIGSEHGWLGAVGFGSCALRLRERDMWMGWDRATRQRFQERVINMARFLIRPQVRCQNLASRVLSLCGERVGRDFAARYGFEPWLLESFVDTAQHAGTCYQAANWLRVGTSTGRGRSAPTPPSKTPKAIYVYELKRDWRRQMGMAPRSEQIPARGLEEGLENDDWVEAEFGNVDLGHQDRKQRLVRIVAAKAQNPAASYSECCAGNRHELKAYYRFIDKEEEALSVPALLKGHRERTVGRMKGLRRVLVIQDTTDLDFSERLRCNGLGDIGKNQTGTVSQGLKMHSALAVSETGLPLGVLDTEIYAAHWGGPRTDSWPIEKKESYRWLRTLDTVNECKAYLPDTEVVVVGDRESDIFELFDHRRRQTPRVHLLVRAQHNRSLPESADQLFDHGAALPVRAEAQIEVPRQREKAAQRGKPGRQARPARTAEVELRWEEVTVAAPRTGPARHLPPLTLYALWVVEPHPPQGAKALHWVLLTTVPLRSRREALRCLRDYTRRWRIEDWHRVLKSGCRIEAHQHHTAPRLARAIALDAVIAWRAMLLALLGREVPEMPVEWMFSPQECRLLEKLQPRVAPETMGVKKTLPGNRPDPDQPPGRSTESKRPRAARTPDPLTRPDTTARYGLGTSFTQ
jgi:hypothetical protein